MNDESPVLVTMTFPERHIALIVIHRPERLNALNLQVKRQVVAAFDAISINYDVRVIVLTGSEKAFAAGTDIGEMAEMTPTEHDALDTGRIFTVVRNCSRPVIAAVEGYALGGGCELALACDMIVAAETARFGQPEIGLGIFPGGGGTQTLIRTIGKYRALHLILTGEPISARDASVLGFVSELVPSGEALSRALALATKIAAKAPLAVRAVKELVLQGQDMPLTSALSLERRTFQLMFGTEDQREGMKAFLEKRPASFRGK
jgi:enoyl-CoA hydratase